MRRAATADRPRPSIALVGLGLLGAAMARRLRQFGHEVVGSDVDEAARAAFRTAGGQAYERAGDAVRGCSVVLLSLPNGQVSRSACLGPGGVVERASPGTLVIDTTTSRPDEAEALCADLEAAGLRFLDVGLSGSSPMVAAGDGIALVGGPRAHLEDGLPVLRDLCRDVYHVGRPGSGMRAKLVVNQVLAINRVALAEALVLGHLAGIETRMLLTILRDGASYSKAMDIWGERMVESRFDTPTSRVRQHVKDADQILELGRSLHAPMPMMSQVGILAHAALASGLSDADNAAVVEVLRRMAGLAQ